MGCLSSIGFQCWKQVIHNRWPRIVIHNELLKIHSERVATSGQDHWSYCGRYWTAWSKELDYANGKQKAQDAEIARLRKEVAKLKMERDILKKAAAYFAKESM